MALDDKRLDDLFLDTLKDIYFAETQIVKALPKMASAAQDPQLKAGFQKHLAESEIHVERLEQIFQLIDTPAEGKRCDAILGILKEGEAIMSEYAGTIALDAGLIAAAQAVEHYEIARYGTLRIWAMQIGQADAAELLEATLDEEHATDEVLTELAIAGGTNEKAA